MLEIDNIYNQLSEILNKNGIDDYILRDMFGNVFGEQIQNGEQLIDELLIPLQGGGAYNVFPGGVPGKCQELCIGFNNKTFNSGIYPPDRVGFMGLFCNMVNYWFRCKINKTNILFTHDWKEKYFNLHYKPTFDTLSSPTYNKKIIVIHFEGNNVIQKY